MAGGMEACALVQDEVDRLDKEIRERHAAEVAGMEARQAHAAAPTDADNGASELADSLSRSHPPLQWPCQGVLVTSALHVTHRHPQNGLCSILLQVSS